MLLSIIIPTKERDEIFNETLRCVVLATQHLNAEIVVVNDSKLSHPIIPKNSGNIKLIINPESGVAAARNIGARNSAGDLLLFLDNDIIVSKKSIDHTIALHEEYEKACFNLDWQYPPLLQNLLSKSPFGRFIKAHNMTSFKGWYNDSSWVDNALFPSSSVASFHLSISRKNFELTGGYNEQFPHAGFEDYDFPTKLKKVGLNFFIDSRVVVDHNESDRLNVENWLNNQERRAQTRKIAVNIGYRELQFSYGYGKRFLFFLILIFYPLLFSLLKVWPNYPFLDNIYFKLISYIQAAKIYKGYTSI